MLTWPVVSMLIIPSLSIAAVTSQAIKPRPRPAQAAMMHPNLFARLDMMPSATWGSRYQSPASVFLHVCLTGATAEPINVPINSYK